MNRRPDPLRLTSRPDLPDELARLARALLAGCGCAGIRLTAWDGRQVQLGSRAEPSTTVALGDLGRLEVWGEPRHPDLPGALAPVVALALERLAAEDAAARDREALSAVTESRAAWIVDGERVAWASAPGLSELDGDPGLAERLVALPDGGDGALEVRVLSGGRKLVQRRIPQDRRAAIERWGLTRAQTRVLDLVVRGLSNKEVGSALGIEESTVEAHLGQIFRRSGTTGRSALVYAFWTA